VATRIELTGRLIRKPELRVTPAGTATLSLEVECGANRERLVLKVVRVGTEVPALARKLKEGGEIRAVGALRQVRAKAAPGTKIEVLADQIMLEPE
jgi:hypothetical protein